MSPRFAPINPVGAGATLPSADGPLPGPERPEASSSDATTPRGHDAAEAEPEGPQDAPAARPRRSKVRAPRQAPKVDEARAMTVRMDPGEADDVDRYILDLRDETGQRLDKAEVVRELLRLAQHNPTVHRALVRRLS